MSNPVVFYGFRLVLKDKSKLEIWIPGDSLDHALRLVRKMHPDIVILEVVSG